MVPLPHTRMGKPFKSTALQTLKRARSSKTCRAQVPPLHPHSGQVGSQMMDRAEVWVLRMAFRMVTLSQSPMLLSMHHKGSCLDQHRPLAVRQRHRQGRQGPVGTRPSPRQATRISVWTCQGTTAAMGTLSGCGSVTEGSRSAGFSITGRSGLVPMNQNASMQVICRQARNYFCGTAMATLSKHGDTMLTLPVSTCPTPPLVWTTTPTGRQMGSLFTCGIATALRTKSGRFGTLTPRPHHPHLPRLDLGPRQGVTAVGLHQAVEVTTALFAGVCAADLTARQSWCDSI